MTERLSDILPVVAERVEAYDLGLSIRWEPNAPSAFFVSDDMGRAALAQRAHPDDQDERCVVLRWDVVSHARMGPPNDEALAQHRLFEAGLRDVLWLGIVRDSNLVEELRPMQAGPFVPVHYIVVSKECVVEVLAENVDVFRIEGSPRQAALASLSPLRRTFDRPSPAWSDDH